MSAPPIPATHKSLSTLDSRMTLAKENRRKRRALKLSAPTIKLYVNDPTGAPGLIYKGRVDVRDTENYEFGQRKNYSSEGHLVVRGDHYLAKYVATVPNTPNTCKNIVVVVDMYGSQWRWSGLLHHYDLETKDGVDYLTMSFNDDLQFLQFMLAPPNPALPIDIFQFPRVWPMFGPSRWCISTLILLQIIRLEGHLWNLPDDPFSIDSWISIIEWQNWQIHIKAGGFFDDDSLWTLLASRMNTVDSVIADALDDGQLVVTYRRIFTAEGETVTGLLNNDIANGALVLEVVDRSGFSLAAGTFFGGGAAGGLVRSVVQYTEGFTDEFLGEVDDDETLYPDEYWQESWLGTLASAPGITVRDSRWNDLQSKVTHSPATAPSVIVGGDNPTADAIVQLIIESVGNLVGYFLLGGFDSLGTIVSDVVMPFLVGTILAWDEWKNVSRAQSLGWVHLFEIYQSGAENSSWSLAALEVLRGGFSGTAAQTCHTMVIDDSTWLIPGAHCQIGDRIASTSGALQRAGLDVLFVNQIEEMTLSGAGDGSRRFLMKVGQNKAALSTSERLSRLFKKALDTLSNIGVHLVN